MRLCYPRIDASTSSNIILTASKTSNFHASIQPWSRCDNSMSDETECPMTTVVASMITVVITNHSLPPRATLGPEGHAAPTAQLTPILQNSEPSWDV